MEIMVLFLVLIVVAVAAPRYGVDSRAAPAGPPEWVELPIPYDGGGSTEDRRSAPAGSPKGARRSR